MILKKNILFETIFPGSCITESIDEIIQHTSVSENKDFIFFDENSAAKALAWEAGRVFPISILLLIDKLTVV